MEVAATVAAHDFELAVYSFHDVGGRQRAADRFRVIEKGQVILALLAQFADEGGVGFGKAVAELNVGIGEEALGDGQ